MRYRYEEVVVTPELAREWLGKFRKRGNRKVHPSVVAKYAREMTRGQWKLNPHPLCFNRDGEGMDYQHRLWAVVISGESVPMIVCWDVDDDIFTVLDQGLKRAVCEVLSESQKLVSLANAVCKAYKGIAALTPSEAAELIAEFRNELEFLANSLLTGQSVKRVTTAGVAAAIFPALVAESDWLRVDFFCKILRSQIPGIEYPEYDPARDGAADLCREFLLGISTVDLRNEITISKIQKSLLSFLRREVPKCLRANAGSNGKRKFVWDIPEFSFSGEGKYGWSVPPNFRQEISLWSSGGE